MSDREITPTWIREPLSCTDCKDYRATVAERLRLAEHMAEAIEGYVMVRAAGSLERLGAVLAAWRAAGPAQE